MRKDKLVRLAVRQQDGQTMVEFGLLLSWMAVVFIPALLFLITLMGRMYDAMVLSLNS